MVVSEKIHMAKSDLTAIRKVLSGGSNYIVDGFASIAGLVVGVKEENLDCCWTKDELFVGTANDSDQMRIYVFGWDIFAGVVSIKSAS